MSDILWYVKLKCALFKSVVKFQKTLRTFCSLWKSIFCFIEESFIIFLSHLDAPASFVPLVDFKERPQQWNWIGRNNYLLCYSPFSVHLNSQSLQNEYWILNMNIPKKNQLLWIYWRCYSVLTEVLLLNSSSACDWLWLSLLPWKLANVNFITFIAWNLVI